MLQAILNKKVNVKLCEDTLTSSVIGLLRFLPDDLFWSVIQKSCGYTCELPTDVGNICDVKFWEKLNAKGTRNKKYVEPDVLVQTENYNVIIEAKYYERSGQNDTQWANEVIAVKKQYSSRKILLIALGGNGKLGTTSLIVENENHPIYRASWLNILNAVNQLKHIVSESHYIRLFDNIISDMEAHGYWQTRWLDSVDNDCIDEHTSTMTNWLVDLGKKENTEYDDFILPNYEIEITNFNNALQWIIAKK